MLMQKELDIFKIYEWQFLSQMLNHYNRQAKRF